MPERIGLSNCLTRSLQNLTLIPKVLFDTTWHHYTTACAKVKSLGFANGLPLGATYRYPDWGVSGDPTAI